MAANHPGARVYALPAGVLVGGLLYLLYGAADRLALGTHLAEATVTGKQLAHGSTTYTSKVVGGRTWTESHQNPDLYLVTLRVDGDTAVGAVSPEMYASLHAGEQVRLEYQRTRISKRILVTGVRP